MAARTRKGTATGGWPVEVRQRIKTSMLINRLTDHAVGKVDLQSTQVKAIEILLRKTLPDLSQIEGTIDHRVRQANELSDTELASIATGRGERADPPEISADEPDQLH